jgi:hypothetical protein
LDPTRIPRESYGHRETRSGGIGLVVSGVYAQRFPNTALALAIWFKILPSETPIFQGSQSLRRTKMKFLRIPLCVLALSLSSVAFSQSEAPKPDAQKPATRAEQGATEIILIGEVHGTEETPRLFSNLVTLAARGKNQRIGVGLELPIILQRLIDEAVKNTTKIDSFREQLLANPAWQKIDDGRSSQAMLGLICDTLQLAESQKVSFFFFDTQNIERDESMAQFIGQRVREQRYDVTFILTGNIHANTAPRHPRVTKIVPMGHRLEEQGFALHSYDVRYSEGETWACTPECGVHHLKGWTADSGAIHQEGYDGILFVGPIHASPPAHESRPLKGAQ